MAKTPKKPVVFVKRSVVPPPPPPSVAAEGAPVAKGKGLEEVLITTIKGHQKVNVKLTVSEALDALEKTRIGLISGEIKFETKA